MFRITVDIIETRYYNENILTSNIDNDALISRCCKNVSAHDVRWSGGGLSVAMRKKIYSLISIIDKLAFTNLRRSEYGGKRLLAQAVMAFII